MPKPVAKTRAPRGKNPAKSNAERQADYRRRHLLEPDTVDSERLNMVVPVSAKRKLERLAAHYGVTQRMLLAGMLLEAENGVLAGLWRVQEKAYYAMTDVRASPGASPDRRRR